MDFVRKSPGPPKREVSPDGWYSSQYVDLAHLYKAISPLMLYELMQVREWLAHKKGNSYATFTRDKLRPLIFVVELYYNKLASAKKFGIVEIRKNRKPFNKDEYRLKKDFLVDSLFLDMEMSKVGRLNSQVIEAEIKDKLYPGGIGEDLVKRHFDTHSRLLKPESLELYNKFWGKISILEQEGKSYQRVAKHQSNVS